MSDILLDVQTPPAGPAAGQILLYGNSLVKKMQSIDDTGLVSTLSGLYRTSVANQTGFATDTYLSGSNIAIPSNLVRVGTTYRLSFDMVKTAAGTATPILNIRFGTTGSLSDTARLVFTFAAGTALVDTGIFEVLVHVRTASAVGVMAGRTNLRHHLAATGLTTTGASGTGIILVTSAAFDMTVPGSQIGASFNGGASFAGTLTCLDTILENV